LPSNLIKHSQYKQLLYKQASEIIRANIAKKKASKPLVKNVSINIDARLFDVKRESKEFNEFVHLRLPYFEENRHRAIFIRLPIRYHKHSLKFITWERKNTIRLKQSNWHYFAIFTYEKEEPIKKVEGKIVGIDQGYKKLIVTSDGQMIGKDFQNLYNKISKKEQGSKNFNNLLIERDKKINEVINKMDFSNINQVVIEALKNVKKDSKKRLKKKLIDGKINIHQYRR